MSIFQSFLPTHVTFDDQGNLDIPRYLDSLDNTFLVISNTLLKRQPELPSCFPNVTVYSEVGSNPDLNQLDQIHVPPHCTQIVGIGGGSKMDAARALFAKLLAANCGRKASLLELIQSPTILDASIPCRRKYKLTQFPTTFGASSEITKWATIWDWQKKKKYSISHDLLYSDKALIFPKLSLTAPKDVTTYTGLDALSHAIESIWNENSNPITKTLALQAVRLCVETLPKLVKNLKSRTLRSDMAKASLFAGMAFSQTQTAAAHALSYPLTLFHEIPHGYACSLTLGVMFDYNYIAEKEVLGEVFSIFQNKYGDKKQSFRHNFSRFLQDCEAPGNLSDFGVKQSDIPRLVSNAFHPDRFKNMVTILSEEQVKDIYLAVL